MSYSPWVRQRGAIGLLGILTLLLGILFATLAVDTGRLMMEKQRLQTVADMAALDASAQAGHCGSGDSAAVEALAEASAARNQHAGELAVALGQISVGAAGVRQFNITPIESATAVSVTASRTVPSSFFAGGILGNEVTLQATAVAERDALAGFSAGSALLSLSDSEAALLNTLLGGTLGSAVALDVLSYRGIAATNIRLGELVEASSSAGSVNELLSSNLTMAEMLSLYAEAFDASDAADVGVSTAMASLIAANVNNLTATFGDILLVTTEDPEAAANTDVNLMDLILTSALVANGDAAVNLPLAVNLPAGLLNVSTQLRVTESPQMAIGAPGRDAQGNWRTQIETAQVELQTHVQSNINLNVLGLAGAQANVDLALHVEVAQGQAWLQSIQCGQINNHQAMVTIGAQPGTAMVNLTRASQTSAPAAQIDVSAIVLLIRVPVAQVDLGLSMPLQNPTATALNYQVDVHQADDLPQFQTATTEAGLALANIPQNVISDISLLGINLNLGALDDAIVSQIVTPLLSQVISATIDPLLSVLGIQLGNLEVQLFAVDIARPEMQR